MMKIKPIRPTNIVLDSKDEYDEFVQWATSTDKTDSEQMNRVRELMKNHKCSPRRVIAITKESK